MTALCVREHLLLCELVFQTTQALFMVAPCLTCLLLAFLQGTLAFGNTAHRFIKPLEVIQVFDSPTRSLWQPGYPHESLIDFLNGKQAQVAYPFLDYWCGTCSIDGTDPGGNPFKNEKNLLLWTTCCGDSQTLETILEVWIGT